MYLVQWVLSYKVMYALTRVKFSYSNHRLRKPISLDSSDQWWSRSVWGIWHRLSSLLQVSISKYRDSQSWSSTNQLQRTLCTLWSINTRSVKMLVCTVPCEVPQCKQYSQKAGIHWHQGLGNFGAQSRVDVVQPFPWLSFQTNLPQGTLLHWGGDMSWKGQVC